MKFTPQGTGFDPQPDSGAQQQGGRTGPIVRMRNRGPGRDAALSRIRWKNCQTFLRVCAAFWSNNLSGGQRAAWDLDAVGTLENGFDRFISTQKRSQGLAFTQPDISSWSGIPVYITPPTHTLFGVGFSEFTGPNIYTTGAVQLRYANDGVSPNCGGSITLSPFTTLQSIVTGQGIWRWQVEPLPTAPAGGYVEVAHAYINVFGPLLKNRRYVVTAYVVTTDGLITDLRSNQTYYIFTV